MEICKICSEEVIAENHFYRKHKLLKSDYYLQHYAKKDLLTGEPLPFKTKEQYFSNDFINKVNLKKWCKITSPEEVKAYFINWLRLRKESKNLVFSPTQVELRTLQSPGLIFLQELFKNDGGFYKICTDIGLVNKFSAIPQNIITNINPNVEILIDTREQTKLNIKHPYKIQTLNYGDYTLADPAVCKNVFIERKSLPDFLTSFGRNIDRLEKEFERAHRDGAYIIVLIESELSEFLSFPFNPFINKKIKASVDFIGHNVRSVLQKFDNIQFLFCSGRVLAADLVKTLLFSNGICKTIDLQLAADMGILTFSKDMSLTI